MKTNTFYFKSPLKPTEYNLAKHLSLRGHNQATHPSEADITDSNLLLNESATQHLEHKHLLAELVNQFCPEVMPPSYLINEQNYIQVLTRLNKIKPSGWILKPSLLNNGEGVKLFKNLKEILIHFKGTDRFDGNHILQKYITKPHLLNDHKYSFRMFVIISNFNGVMLYPQGYFNICKTPYEPNDFTKLSAHLTNEHLNTHHGQNNWQIPTAQCPNFESIYKKMKSTVQKTITALQQLKPDLFSTSSTPAFSIFGYDFMLDEKLNLWLLEINHGPCFPTENEHILQKHLYDQFWPAVIKQFVEPITLATKPTLSDFDPIIMG